jgi:hypothetical protein
LAASVSAIIVLLFILKIENEMGWARSANGEERGVYRVLVWKETTGETQA